LKRGNSLLTRLLLGAQEQRQRLTQTLRIDRSPSQRPLPRVGIGCGPWLPAWVLRVVQTAVAVGCISLLQTDKFLAVVALIAALALLVRPGGLSCGIFAVILGLDLSTAVPNAIGWRSYLLIFGLHLVVLLAMLAPTLRWNAAVELRMLVSPARRFVVLQSAAQLLALCGAAVSGLSLSLPWLAAAVGIGLAVLAWWLLSRLSRAE
jgi:hypothetical protein